MTKEVGNGFKVINGPLTSVSPFHQDVFSGSVLNTSVPDGSLKGGDASISFNNLEPGNFDMASSLGALLLPTLPLRKNPGTILTSVTSSVGFSPTVAYSENVFMPEILIDKEGVITPNLGILTRSKAKAVVNPNGYSLS